jgi:hypothetical protein
MNGALVAGLLMAVGFQPASDVFPEPDDFRFQTIRKATGEKNWPFIAESGMLGCAKVLGEPTVYFVPDEADLARAFLIDINLFAMSITNLGVPDVLAPYGDSAELLYRLVPFVTMGQRLCDQDPGTLVTGPEL